MDAFRPSNSTGLLKKTSLLKAPLIHSNRRENRKNHPAVSDSPNERHADCL
jgi:hypothetical protein